jgi:hypothetical protein
VASHPSALDKEPTSLDASIVVYLSQFLAREALGEPGLSAPPDEALDRLGITTLMTDLRAAGPTRALAGGR